MGQRRVEILIFDCCLWRLLSKTLCSYGNHMYRDGARVSSLIEILGVLAGVGRGRHDFQYAENRNL